MKKRIVLPSFICLLAVSCTVKELDIAPIRAEDDEVVFYATMESGSEQDTRVYLDNENIKIFWNANDKVSIFKKSTLNQQYKFKGEDGANAGEFHRVPNDCFGAGNDLDYICSVYPYQESTSISNSGELTFILPAEQTYKENSFGLGANTMVSVTEDNMLQFKNVGGYLGLKFYGKEGKDVIVSSIRLTGKNMESLSGKATMTPVLGENPTITMAPETVGSSIVLNCETPVQLGASAESPTIFWMVVPPTDFTQGLTVTITNPDGDVFILETNRTDLKIERNKILRFSATMVDFDGNGLKLNDILPVNEKPRLMTEVNEANRTITVTMPTITDFSDLLFDYAHTGTGVMVNGVNIEYENSIPTTHINASRKTDEDGFHLASVVVRNGKYGKNYTLKARNTGLPVVRITTDKLTNGSDGFSLEYLESFQNRVQGLDLRPKDTVDHRVWLPETDGVFVSVRIENPDGSPGMKDGDVPVYETNTQIKGRGNYSWKWEKKPYALKFENKKEVLGMPTSKRWILLANWRDRTLLRNDAAFWLSRRAGLPYTVRGEFVELEINGEHRGNYYLCEQIKIDENRVNITEMKMPYNNKTGGFLMEIDSYFDEIRRFRSAHFNLKYMFKDPDVDVKTDTSYRVAYHWMKGYIDTFEKSLKTASEVSAHKYEDYLDVNSAISFVMVNELTGNRDFFQNGDEDHYGPHSAYLYKDKGKKLFMGPVWDFDYETFIPEEYYPKDNWWATSGTFKWRGFDNTGYYFYYMCQDSKFVKKVQDFWKDFKNEDELKTEFAAYINDMAAKISLSQKFDEARWPYDPEKTSQTNRKDNHDYALPFLDPDAEEDAIRRMINSFNARVDWMTTQIADL